MPKLGRSLLLAIILVGILCGSALAQTVTQETYSRLEMNAIKGVIYGTIDSVAALRELGQGNGAIDDAEWQNRWYNAGFLIGWHSDTILKMEAGENKLIIGIQQGAQSVVNGYDTINLGLKSKNETYIRSGGDSIKAGMTILVKAYSLVEPSGLKEIELYQIEKFGSYVTPTTVAATPMALVATPTTAAIAISSTVGTVNKSANLRAGPGTTYAIAGSAKAGDKVEIVGKNADSAWLKLADGKWIAAFLVNQGQSLSPVAGTTPAATVIPTITPTATVALATPEAATPPPTQDKPVYWGDTDVQTCGNFEWRMSNIRRSKDTWFYDRHQVAQGEYLIFYIEVKNISSGTASFWEARPTMPGKDIAERASQYAAWMMTGGFNTLWKDDIAPGEFITLVGAFDVAPDTHTYLFGTLSCTQIVAVGSWFELERGAIKASN